jgi:hypothetical protein
MATTVTRVNGSSTTVGTIYNPNANLFIIQVKNTSNANIDLQLEDSTDSDGAGADVAVTNGTVEYIVREINPLAWFTPAASAGYIYVVMDKAINSAAELQTRIRRIGLKADGTTSVGPNAVDISGTTVVDAVKVTFALV